tara:strand:- start:3654 stop:4022 length:369 start_codon:yes stop_codon:yes gene_type:complete
MKGNIMNNLPKDFVQSEEYCVIEPGLTKFNKDQIISHKDLMSLNDISEIKVIPHMSNDIEEDESYKDYEKLTSNIAKILEVAEDKVSDLIEDYNEKYEDQYIDTVDMSSLFTQLKDYVEDHS